MNKIILSGNICKDIELKYYGDKHCIKNSIAVRRDFKNKDNEYDTDFYNFTIWGAQAEFMSKYASKGAKILISGKILNNNYENKDGNTVFSNDIQVENIEIISRKENENDQLKDFGDIVEIDNSKSKKEKNEKVVEDNFLD